MAPHLQLVGLVVGHSLVSLHLDPSFPHDPLDLDQGAYCSTLPGPTKAIHVPAMHGC
jgi:hypothetical protein